MKEALKNSITTPTGKRLMEMYERLWKSYGPQNWWPAKGAFEVIVGAVLTQNTNWKNVERAIKNLKEKNLLSLRAIYETPVSYLEELIRPAGYYRIKAKRLKNLIQFIAENYGFDLDGFLKENHQKLREELISVKGIGPETADSILLYACLKPLFVVDAYTYRVLKRHNMVEDEKTYSELQALFMEHLPEDVALYNEFHALIVKVGKEHCKNTPRCDGCPLNGW